MATNFPGPYEVEFKYSVDGVVHTQRISTEPDNVPTVGDDPSTIPLKTRAGGTITLSLAASAWVTLIKDLYATTVTFDTYDLWKYTPGTFIRTWISGGSLAIAGTAGGAYIKANQHTFTFRTVEGGVMRLVLLETSNTSLVREPYGAIDPGRQGIMDYVVATTSWMLARDTSYPIVQLNAVGGQNEAIFKNRYR